MKLQIGDTVRFDYDRVLWQGTVMDVRRDADLMGNERDFAAVAVLGWPHMFYLPSEETSAVLRLPETRKRRKVS